MKLYWALALALVVVCVVLHMSGLVRFNTKLHWSAWAIAGLVLLNAGWMAFDGGRALIAGDYFTPRAGQLGTWSKVVGAVGIEPRSTSMKVIFLIYGLAYLGSTAALLLGAPWGWWGALLLAALGLWYVPFGTLINLIVIVLLLLPALRTPS